MGIVARRCRAEGAGDAAVPEGDHEGDVLTVPVRRPHRGVKGLGALQRVGDRDELGDGGKSAARVGGFEG